MIRFPDLTARLALRLRTFAGHQGGGATILTAFVLLAAIGIATVSIDGSKYYYLRRVQQSTTDIAAVAAASDLTHASSLALTSTGTNSFVASSVSNVELGTYLSDPTLPSNKRFTPTSTAPNAVRVTLQTQPPFVFGGMLNAMLSGGTDVPAGFQVRTRAVAMNGDLAAFSLSSGLAKINGGIENAVMGALIGSTVSLSAMDWQALAAADVDLFAFASALNTRAQLKAVTVDDVAKASVTRTTALKAAGDALSAGGASASATAALASFAAASGLTSASLPMSSVVSFGPIADTQLTAIAPITAKVSALDLLTAITQVANGRNEVQTDLALGLPGISSAHLSLVIGEPTVSTSLIAIGAKGATMHTAQTRLSLKLKLIGSGLTPTVNLPIYIELASGTAQLSSIACSANAGQATLGVTPGVVDGWIGTISDADLTDLGGTPSISDATFFSLLGLAQVTGHSHAAVANSTPTPVGFSQSEIAAQTTKTTSTSDFVASLYSSLMNNLSLKVVVIGAGLPVPTGLDTSVKTVLAGAAASVDQSLTLILSALGVNLGNASTKVTGVKCGRSSLVN